MEKSFPQLRYPHVLDVTLSRTLLTFDHGSSPEETPHLPVFSLPYLMEIYPLHPLNCRLTFRQVNTVSDNLVHTSPPSTSKVGSYAAPSVCDMQCFGETDILYQRPFLS